MLTAGKGTEAEQNLNTDTPHTADTHTDKGDTITSPRPPVPIPPDEGKVKVRIVKFAERAKASASVDKTETDTDPPPSQKHLDIPAEKKAQLESTVKDALEKSGLETQGKLSFFCNQYHLCEAYALCTHAHANIFEHRHVLLVMKEKRVSLN